MILIGRKLTRIDFRENNLLGKLNISFPPLIEVQGAVKSFKQILKQRQPLSGTGFFLAFT